MALVATGLTKPRSIAFDTSGNLMVVESGAGITNLVLQDNGGICLSVTDRKPVIRNSGVLDSLVQLNHGLALSQDGRVLFASTSEAAYSWDYDAAQSSVSESNRTLVTNMNNSDHTTRTLLLSQKADGMLVVSRGSASNIDAEAGVLSSGHSHVRAFNVQNVSDTGYDFNTDGLRLGWGLRNSVGLAEHPDTGGIYSVENSADGIMREGKDVHQDNPGEEMNFLGYLNGTEYDRQGSNYGYPHCFAAWVPEDLPQNENIRVGTQFAMSDQNNTINDTFCADQTPPRLTFQAHMAPLDIKFNNSATEAWVTFRGSWDRTSPVGYKLSVIPFANGEPVAGPDNKTAAIDILTNADNSRCPTNCFRPVGIAFDQQGRLFMSSDATGDIFVVMRDQASQGSTALRDVHPPSLAESHAIIKGFQRRDALIGQNSLREKQRSVNYSNRQGIRARGAQPYPMSIKHVCSMEDIPPTQHSKGFARLPPEINQEIAKYLSDKDVVSFARLQRETYEAVIPVHAGHWRVRFKQQFDLEEKKSPATIAADYKSRKLHFTHKVFFKFGNDPKEILCLEAIRQMIIESHTHSRDAPSNNYQQLARFKTKSNLLFDAFRLVKPHEAPGGDIEHLINPLLLTIHVVFFADYLICSAVDTLTGAYPLSLRQTVYNIKWSQDVVLDAPERPLVNKHGAINMGLLYHLTNFWRFHLVLNDDSSLHTIFINMAREYQPYAPTRRLKENTLFSRKRWAGALFHPYVMRQRSFDWNGTKHNDVYTDGFFTGGDGLLALNLDWMPGKIPWPQAFEEQVHAFPDPLDDLAQVLDHKYKIRAVERRLSKKERRRMRSKATSPHRSGPDAYRASLPLRPTTIKGGEHAEVIPKTKKLEYRIFFGKFDEFPGDQALNIAGVVHPLPPQSGLPGWQRITMVTYETPASGTPGQGYLDADYVDLSVFMRFEGVVCPGGNIMLGRYHVGEKYDTEIDYGQPKKRGPFIFWNTSVMQDKNDDAAAAADEDTSEDSAYSTDDDFNIPEIDEDTEDDWYWLAALRAQQSLSMGSD
ncbi:MAG: hypothetical protein LQ341_003513 [Variospora aurantia]|nr:MAG: hypothetical protein LQ341_003513 [Variospora aurantia]